MAFAARNDKQPVVFDLTRSEAVSVGAQKFTQIFPAARLGGAECPVKSERDTAMGVAVECQWSKIGVMGGKEIHCNVESQSERDDDRMGTRQESLLYAVVWQCRRP